MKRLFLSFVLGIGIITTCCYGKESKMIRKEIVDKIAGYNEQFKTLSDEEIIAKLNKFSIILPNNIDELTEAKVVISQIAKRNMVTAKDTLKKIIKRGEESPNNFVKIIDAFVPEITLMYYAKEALLRIEENEELSRKGKITMNEKAEYLIEKVKRGEKVSSFLEEMAPQIVPQITELLKEKEEGLKIYALGLLGKTGTNSFQSEIIEMTEKEINKPKYGLFFHCQRVLESVGDKKAYNYLKKKLTHSDPIVRESTAIGLIKFWERGIVTQRDIKNTLVPLLEDKNKEVSEEIRFHLLDKGLINENESGKNN